MEVFFYILLAAVLYGLLAESTDRAVEREMRKRREATGGLHLVEGEDAEAERRPRLHALVRRARALRSRARAGRTG
jgi:hypothetical protein